MYKFTGNPFVDAGIVAMCAAAKVESPEQLDNEAVNKAVAVLIRLMTSEAAFASRVTGKKNSRFSTSEMSVIFPNGVHANPSGKADKQKETYISRIKVRRSGAGEDVEAGELCCLSGEEAAFRVGKSEFPMLDSKDLRNFHPEHQAGHPLNAENALAIEFFPLSVLRTGKNEGYFWFIHTANSELAILCAELTQKTMNEQIARNEGLGFFGEWRVASKNPESAFVALIRSVMTAGGNNPITSRDLKKSELPVTAYVFSNDNRSTEMRGQDLPHELFAYFLALRGREANERFQREILSNENLCWRVAPAMLKQFSIARMCCARVGKQQGQEKFALKGGWQVHSIYAKEVLGMSVRFIRAIEEISGNLFDGDKRSKALLALRGDEARRSPSAVLHRFVKWEAMTSEQYQLLAPPTNYNQAFVACDYLLAALFERINLEDKGKEFPLLPDIYALEAEPAKHPLLVRVERIGEALLKEEKRRSSDVFKLSKATRSVALRGVFLNFIARQCATYDDFVTLFPLEPGSYPAFQARDYLLAFLYDRLRDEELPDPEPITAAILEGVTE